MKFIDYYRIRLGKVKYFRSTLIPITFVHEKKTLRMKGNQTRFTFLDNIFTEKNFYCLGVPKIV